MGMNKGQETKREREQNGTGNRSSAKTVSGGGGDLRESLLRMKLVALGEEVLLQRSPSLLKKQRRKKLGEEEQAAVCLMALSCGFVFA